MKLWRISRHMVTVFALMACLSSVTWGNAWQEKVGTGVIDWESKVIKVSGFGVPSAGVNGAQAKLLSQRAAKLDAYRNALEVIEGVRVHSDTQVEDFAVTSDVIKSNLDGFIKGAQFEIINCDLTNTCEAILVLPLEGSNSLSSHVGTAAREQVLQVADSFSTGVATVIRDTIDVKNSNSVTPDLQVVYTGIIIDATGFGVWPAMFLQVFDAEGRVVYGPGHLSPDTAATATMAGYARSLDKATAMSRIGNNPLVVKANGTPKASKTDITLDSATSNAVRRADADGVLFAKAAVVVVID